MAHPVPDGIPGFAIMAFGDCADAVDAGAEAVLLALAADDDSAIGAIAATLRAISPRPLLVVTDRASAAFEIPVLGAGADGVAVLPMLSDLLAARLEALLRRGGTTATVLSCGDLRIDLLSRSVTRAGRRIDLLPREYMLLVHLARQGGVPVARRQLLADVWRLNFDPGTNVVQVHMSRLRAKIDRGFAAPLLHCSKGIGYSLSPDVP